MTAVAVQLLQNRDFTHRQIPRASGFRDEGKVNTEGA